MPTSTVWDSRGPVLSHTAASESQNSAGSLCKLVPHSHPHCLVKPSSTTSPLSRCCQPAVAVCSSTCQNPTDRKSDFSRHKALRGLVFVRSLLFQFPFPVHTAATLLCSLSVRHVLAPPHLHFLPWSARGTGAQSSRSEPSGRCCRPAELGVQWSKQLWHLVRPLTTAMAQHRASAFVSDLSCQPCNSVKFTTALPIHRR